MSIILSHLIICLPYSIWMMRAFFNDLPNEIEQAAYVDGCNQWDAFYKISLPLVTPGIVVTGLFCFRGRQNNYESKQIQFYFSLLIFLKVMIFHYSKK